MIIFYTTQITDRLTYICNLLLKEQLGLDYIITTDKTFSKNADDVVLNYSNEPYTDAEIFIRPKGLLFENQIQHQHTGIFSFPSFFDHQNNITAFFSCADADFPFDIFSASFYLVSRYEEYLPHHKDMYGRYAHENSLAFQQGFLNLPLINIWIKEFGAFLQQKNSGIKISSPAFDFILTYDIDIAWSYLHKGWLRNLGGFIRKPSLNRIFVLLNRKNDPFDSYDFLDGLHASIKNKIIYFFLLAKQNGQYDKNILPKKMKKLISEQSSKYTTGIHPSWASNSDIHQLSIEIDLLQSMINKPVKHSRQHYIKMDLPKTYQKLISHGITKEYSMGYGSINGFRASFAGSFYWYDLANETATQLRIYPFCFMDANCHYEASLSPQESAAELDHYHNICKDYNGLFISIFHNNFLGSSPEFTGWKALYQEFIPRLLR